MIVSSTLQQLFSLILSSLFIFSFISFAFGINSTKTTKVSASDFTTIVFFQDFNDFSSYIQVFELIFIYSVRWCSSFILLHVDFKAITCSLACGSSTINWRALHSMLLAPYLRLIHHICVRFISGLLVFQWSMCLFFVKRP